jgi:hypothetical protein
MTLSSNGPRFVDARTVALALQVHEFDRLVTFIEKAITPPMWNDEQTSPIDDLNRVLAESPPTFQFLRYRGLNIETDERGNVTSALTDAELGR